VLGWRPSRPVEEGLEKTYAWIDEQVKAAKLNELVVTANA